MVEMLYVRHCGGSCGLLVENPCKNEVKMNFHQDIVAAYKVALQKAVSGLFLTGESFYYLSLVVDENGLPPVFSAWSRESFFAACKQMDDEQALWMKWSYSDSPYFEFGAVYFAEANELWQSKGGIDDFITDDWIEELAKRVNSLEKCFAELDADGFFSGMVKRTSLMINVETTPPTEEDTQRAQRLNPPEAIKEWLEEAAE